jgi:hypothetical protein
MLNEVPVMHTIVLPARHCYEPTLVTWDIFGDLFTIKSRSGRYPNLLEHLAAATWRSSFRFNPCSSADAGGDWTRGEPKGPN